jgi:ADP-heptose:LPS heptosyltransferase
VLAELIARVEGRRPALGPADFALSADELPALGRADAAALAGLPSPGRALLLHAGASDPAKAPPARVLDAIERAGAARGLEPVRVLGPVEVERGAAVPDGPRLVAPSLPLLAHAMARAALHAGGDTGPTHLASALGVPTLAVHGVPNPAWRPRGARACVMATDAGERVLEVALDGLLGTGA